MPTGTASSQWIPLRDDYFETALLSSKETAYLVRKSCEAAQEVVERARSTGGPIQWRHVEKYNDVQLYAGFSRGTYSTEPTSMCGVTTVPGTIKEVAGLFDMGTTRAMKDFSKDHRDLFFDAVVLYTLSPRTKEKPLHQVTAKWIATHCPKGMDDRDYCYLECQDKFVDSSGRKGWVMCLHSIKLPGCEELTREFGFVRGSMYHSGVVVVEADRPGYVDVIHMLQINLKNNTKMPQAYLRERVAWIARLKRVLRHKRLNEQRYLSDLELVPKKYRSRCNVCEDSFSLLLLRKMNCRKCGEVVCGACSKEFDVTNAKFLETVKLRICMHCYQMITTGQSQANMMDPPHASTISLLGYHEDNQRASIITELPDIRDHGGNPQAVGRETRTKIYLQTMRERQQQERRSHRIRESDAGHRMGPLPPPMSTGDPLARGRHARASTRAMPQQRNTINYDARSLFDAPRGGRGNSYRAESSEEPPLEPDTYQFPPPPSSSASSASVFDRNSSRSRASDYDMRRREDNASRQTISLASPGSSSRSKQRNSTSRDSRGAFKIPHSLYDYSALDPESVPTAAMSPRKTDRRGSTGSTGSIDIDVYQAGATYPVGPPAEASNRSPALVPSKPRGTDGHDSNSTEGSIGSDSDSPVPPLGPKRSSATANRSKYLSDDEEEETKSPEYKSTPALPPPSPSAFHTTHSALQGSQRSMDLPFSHNLLISDASSMDGGDTSYLDSEMRQFHGQPFYMRGASSDRGTIDMSNMDQLSPPAKAGTVLYSPDSGFVNASRAIPPAVTSPDKPPSMVDRPPLYGRPRKEQANAPSSNDTTVTNASVLSSGSHLLQSFDVQASMISNVSAFPQDLAFQTSPQASEKGDDAQSVNESESPVNQGEPPVKEAEQAGKEADQPVKQPVNEAEKAVDKAAEPVQEPVSSPVVRAPPPPPPPSYVPSRFQTRASDSNQLDINDLYAEPPAAKTKKSESKPAPRRQATVEEIQAAMARNSFGSDNQDDSDDDDSEVDFEELLRLPVTSQDDRLRGLSQASDLSHGSSDLGEVEEESEDSDMDNQDLLSARRMFKKFGSSKRLTAMVRGGDHNQAFQRTFDQIQESIDMLSDSDNDDGVEWSEDAGGVHKVRL